MKLKLTDYYLNKNKKEFSKVISFRATQDVINQLDIISESDKRVPSEVCRALIELALEKIDITNY